MRRTMLLLVVALALLVPGLARANDPTYPITSFTDWLGGPAQSLQDPQTGMYTLEAGFIDGVRRILANAQAHAGDDPRAQIQALFDSLTHIRPDPPYTHITDAGDPAYSPDWNHDGAYGDTAETSPGGVGDFDVDVDGVHDTAYFRYPCLSPADGWALHYVRANGSCDVHNKGGTYRLGVAHEVTVIDARGLALAATVWIPADAFRPGACPAFRGNGYASRTRWASCVRPSSLSDKRFPGIVFSDGIASLQQYYYWFAERMVAEGYIVLTYDPAGQGSSEGTASDVLGLTLAKRPSCQLAGACMDVQDMTRWFTGRSIVRVADNEPRVSPRKDLAKNVRNPVLPILDTSRIALSGHSMGAISTLSYVKALGSGRGFDGRPLPPIKAAAPLSGAFPTHAVVPMMFETSDFDGSPTTLAPAVLGVELGGAGEGIGYHMMKGMYDALEKTKEPAPLEMLVYEGGVHTDFADQPPIFRTTWSLGIAGWYTSAWFDCFLKGSGTACARAHTRIAHLSRAFASEQDPDGPRGPSHSRCIQLPTEASLNQTPQEFAAAETGKPLYTCTP